MVVKKVLLVEDDEIIMKILKAFFKNMGLETISAPNGKVALEIFKKEDIHLVISDLKMPVMKGDSLFAEIREINAEVPFFLLTGYVDHTSVTILQDMGITGVIKKPITFDDLREALHDYLGIEIH